MGFKLPDEWIEKQKETYDLKYITYQDKKIHVSELEDRSVTPEMRSQMRMNSYAQDDLPPKLTNEALLLKARQYLNECTRTRIPCSTYDEALIHNITPELIKRLEELEKENEQIKSAYDDRCCDITYLTSQLRKIDNHIRSTNEPVDYIVKTLKDTLPEYHDEFDL